MAFEHSDSVSPETATNSLVLGPKNRAFDGLWGNVGELEDRRDYHAVNVEAGVSQVTLSLGLWFTEQFKWEAGVYFERRELTLVPLSGTGPTVTAVASFGLNNAVVPLGMFQQSIDYWQGVVDDPDQYSWMVSAAQASELLAAYERAFEVTESAVNGGTSGNSAAAEIESIAAGLEGSDNFSVRSAASDLRGAMESVRGLNDISYVIRVGSELYQGSGILPVGADPKYTLAAGSTKLVFQVTGKVTVDRYDVDTESFHSEARPLGYDLMARWSTYSKPSPAEQKGDAGKNVLRGTDEADRLLGLGGNDTLIGGAGADRLDGGAGSDTASYATAKKAITASLAKPSINTGDAKGDTYVSIENLLGGKYADRLTGDGRANRLDGGAGNDTLKGNAGNDKLTGGQGADDLWGGAGKDVFVFAKLSDSTASAKGRDTVFDFAHGDRFDLSALDASTKKGGNQAFTWIGADTFGGKAGELRFDKKQSDTYVTADVNGDKRADFGFHLDDAVKLVKGDFIL